MSADSAYAEDRLIVQNTLDGNTAPLIHFLQTDCRFLFRKIQNSILQNLDVVPNDLVHDFYIFLNENNWKKLRSFRFQSKLLTWTNSVAVRYFMDEYKKELLENARKNPQVDESMLQALVVPDKTFPAINLQAAIAKLKNPRERMILQYTLQNYPSKKIAEELKISIGNLYTLRNRAINHLKQQINENR